ncbi:MAG: 2-iminoacetate synthase ThiH [Candidatus Omnitrophica bacterium]|nr:2-iminoacetate synthase ThiH [Candidatus Omnitrophota bacterium]
MSFYDVYLKYKDFPFEEYFLKISKNDIIDSLNKHEPEEEDLLSLLSPQAENFLETLASKAKDLTQQHFGKAIVLYTPLYLSNYCENECAYCGFNIRNNIPRKQLDFYELRKEAETIAKTGLKHILILTGESKKITPLSYIKQCIEILNQYFSSVSIEIYTLSRQEYKELISLGVDGLTIYQEVYNQESYNKLHLSGPKTDYRFRLDAPERALMENMRTVNIGALLGLKDFRSESFFMLMHAYYLQHKYSQAEISISVPRIRPQVDEFIPPSSVSDKNIVQIITAARIFLPRIGITLSTRENKELRDNLLPLGVTKMSAGSITTVGGHTICEPYDKKTSQFEIADKRGVSQIKETLLNKGYQPVFKDWVGHVKDEKIKI